MNAAKADVDPNARRIYVQLAPDARGRKALTDVQSGLPIPRSGRMVSADELHMTLIHFGKADDVYAAVSREAEIGRQRYDEALGRLIAGYESLAAGLDGQVFALTPTGFDGLGKNGHTLVIRYEAPAELYDAHGRALALLKVFFGECGIADAGSFMAGDPNFRYSLSFTPHVTVYKGYDGPLPNLPLAPVTMGLMKIVY